MSAIRPESKPSPLRPRDDDRPLVPPTQDEPPPLSVVALLNVLLRRRRIVLGAPVVAVILMLVAWALPPLWEKVTGPAPVTYVATTTFDVESGGGGGNASPVGSLAAQLGLGPREPSAPP